MTALVVLPAIFGVGAALSARPVHRRLKPSLGTPLLAATVALAALAAVGGLLLVAGSYLVHSSWLVVRVAWLPRAAADGDTVGATFGVPAVAAVLVIVVMMARTALKDIHGVRAAPDGGAVTVVADGTPIAYTVPGRRRRIVVSTGMLRTLDAGERRALFAHERSHLRRRHSRYVAVGRMAATAVPALRPLAAELRFATERWADEDAAAEVGDRSLVARALLSAALASVDERDAAALLALSGADIADRIEALMEVEPETVWRPMTPAFQLAIVALVTTLAAAAQMRHLLVAGLAHFVG